MTKEELIELRKKLHMTQEEFAPLLGVKMDALSAWERGKTPISRPSEMLALQLKEAAV
jgi:DNA-binding transcriptional regulator YiaG